MQNNSPTYLTRLSQGHLNLLETCPRKFQHIYLEQLGSPIDTEQQERGTWGSQFHLLMQQRELGLPVESLFPEDDPLRHSINALVQAVPEILAPNADSWRDAEHYRTLNFSGYLLAVIYDLLVTDSQNAKILDWKTYPLPENSTKIATSWQTRLYLFVLAETSNYSPEQLSMTYWFVKLPDRPHHLTLAYDRQQHERTRQDLTHLLAQLDEDLERYIEEGIAFPQVPEAKGACRYCSFNRRCQRAGEESNPLTVRDWRVSVAEIEEVAL
jgi:PD-(D/E)XK nuclease superfamily